MYYSNTGRILNMETKGILLDIASLHTTEYKEGAIVSLIDSGNEIALSIQSKKIVVKCYDKKKDIIHEASFIIKELIDLIFKQAAVIKEHATQQSSVTKKTIKRKR